MLRALTLAAAVAVAAPAFAQIGSQVPTDGTDRNDGREGYAREGTEARQTRDRTEGAARAGVRDAAPGAAVRLPPENRGGDFAREDFARGAGAAGDASAVPADALARWVSQDNRAEVNLARFAQGKTENDRVKRFAEAMIQAHTAFGEKLDGLTGPAGAADAARRGRTSAFRGGDAPAARPNAGRRDVDPADPGAADLLGDDLPEVEIDVNPPQDPAEIRRDDANEDVPLASRGDASALPADATVGTVIEPNTSPLANPDIDDALADDADLNDPAAGRTRLAARPVAPAGPGATESGATAADVLAFRENLKQRCGQTLTQQFDRLTPSDFDKAYASQQIGAHLAMIDTLALAARQAQAQGNREAAEVFEAGKQETTRHLTMAIALLNEVTPQPVE